MSQIKVELQSFFGDDKSIADSAWTSSLDYQKKKTRSDEDVKRIVKMLAENKHSTPFESVVFRFWMRVPIQTDRQHMSHRLQSTSGMSGRYRTMPSDFLQVPDDVKTIMSKAQKSDLEKEYETICEHANWFYNDMLTDLKVDEKAGTISNSEYKRAREFFRGVLPQNNMTERVFIINLRSFANYMKLRNSPHAQPEIQEVAKQMLEAVKKANVCPIALQELEKNGWVI
jgi:thymidylate synthase (FAD)